MGSLWILSWGIFPSSRSDWCCPPWCWCAKPDADLVMMVKPQFEVGKERLGSGGVVRSPQLRAEAVCGVAGRAAECWGSACRA